MVSSHRAVRRDCPERGLNPGGIFGLGKEGCSVLQHQSVQRGLLGAVALAVDLGAIRRQVGLLHRGLHALPMSKPWCFMFSNRAARRHCT